MADLEFLLANRADIDAYRTQPFKAMSLCMVLNKICYNPAASPFFGSD
jgi:hypothetical protein